MNSKLFFSLFVAFSSTIFSSFFLRPVQFCFRFLTVKSPNRKWGHTLFALMKNLEIRHSNTFCPIRYVRYNSPPGVGIIQSWVRYLLNVKSWVFFLLIPWQVLTVLHVTNLCLAKYKVSHFNFDETKTVLSLLLRQVLSDDEIWITESWDHPCQNRFLRFIQNVQTNIMVQSPNRKWGHFSETLLDINTNFGTSDYQQYLM